MSIRRGETVRPETLAEALWGDEPPATWTKSVQACIVHLRRALGVRAIETQPHGYRLAVPADDIDVHRFERLVARAHELLAVGDPDRAAYVADEALGLWRGPALVDLDGWEPGRAEAERLDELRRDAQEVRLEATLHSGRFREVLAEARAMVADAPLREHRWSLLALAQYQAGRQAEALRTIRQARSALREELGLDPGPELVALERAILHQDPSLVATALPEPSGQCPYLGLVPYDVSDADGFFGRDAEVSECLHRLAETGALAVVGPSGSGKSSLVRAGVAAALDRDGHRVVVITPGAHPMDALTAVSTSARPAVLVVDQCEEAVTLCADAAEQAQFFTALADHAERALLVVALRADRLGEVTGYPAFARLVERGLFLLRPMEEDDLRAAIEGPARQAGLRLEPGLVDLLIRDVEGEPGALPLLSHALHQTWQRREGRTLTVAGYQASGGIRGAVAQSAETVYEQAPPEQRPILRDLLLRLVAPSPEGEPVRSRVPRRVVATDPEHEQIIEQLVRARLVTSDEDVVEIAHESLARAWPRLRGWLDDDVEGQRIWRHLSSAADSWEAMGRPSSELYRGVRLARAIEWRDRSHPDLNPTERAFLDLSQQHIDHERRTVRRRRRALVVGLAVGLAVTTVLSAVALVSQQRADQEAAVARSRELTNAAIIAMNNDPSLAKLLALAAAEHGEPPVELLSVLHGSLAADQVIDRYTWPDDHEAPYLTASLHPAGNRLVASGTSNEPTTHLEVYDFDSADVVWSWDTGDSAASVDVPFFSPDGEWVVAGMVWAPGDEADPAPQIDPLGVYVWDADTGELAQRIAMGSCGGLVLDMSGSSMLVQTHQGDAAPACWTGASPLALTLVDLETGVEQELSTHAWGRRAALSGDGRFVAFTEDDDAGPVSVVLDLARGERILEFDPFASEGHAPAEVLGLNQDGSLLVAGVNPIMVWDVATGDRIATFDRHGGDAWPRFAPDGVTVYSVGQDSTLRHWDARTGSEIASYPAVGRGLTPSVGVNGRVLVADANGRQASLVDTRPAAELWSVDTCDGYVWAQTLGISGDRAALSVQCADEHLTYVIDLGRRQVDYTLPLHRGQALVISPDGTRFVRQEGSAPEGVSDGASDGSPDEASGGAFWHGPPRVRDLATGEALAEFEDVCTYDAAGVQPPGAAVAECQRFPETPFELFSWVMTWSPDSTMVAVGGAPRVQLAIWDADTGSMVGDSDACTGMAQGMQFSPNGEELFLFCVDEGVLSVLSTRTWEELRRAELDPQLEGRSYMALAGFTPGDEWLVGVGGAMFVGGVGMLHWIDPQTLKIDQTLPRIHDGTPKSWAMSPDRTLLATGASDGSVKVWDVVQRRLVHEIDIGEVQAQGLAFVDDDHLAIAPETGGVFVYTLDADELLGLVRSALTRGLTASECQRFNFEDCPTLDDLR